jgi:hypothetical protein
MQQITKTSEKLTRKVIVNRISDVPGGVSLTLADLIVGNAVYEGTPLSVPANGKRTVCKQAKMLAGCTTTVFRVETGTHHFKVGEYLMQTVGGPAYAITAVAVDPASAGYDTLTVGTALASAAEGGFLYKSSATGAAAGALANPADVILKEAFEVPAATQVIWMADAYLRADVNEGYLGSLYLAQLDVREVKY